MSHDARSRLQLLEAMRGMAAVWVVLHHADLSTGTFLQPIGNAPLVSNGYLGVDFFFVLSGFIIAVSTGHALSVGGTFYSYLQSRAIRIYVPYLPVGLGILFLYWIFPDVSAAPRAHGMLTSVLLLPTNSPPALSVAWTLVHELIFYAVYGLVFVSQRVLLLVLALWAAAILLVATADMPLSRFESYFLSPLNLCFHLGVGVFYASTLPLVRLVHTLAAIVGSITMLVAASMDEPNRVAVAIACALLLFSASSVYWRDQRVWGIAALLGTASYSIYLVHNPVVSLASRGLRIVDASMDPWLALVLVSVTSIAVGLLYWFAYERHALQFVRAKLTRPQVRRVLHNDFTVR